MGIVLRAIQNYGTTEAPLAAGPPFFRFSDPAECQRALEAVGFAGVQSSTLPLVWQFPDAQGLFAAYQAGTVRLAALLRAQTPAALESIRAAVRAEAATYATARGVEVPMGAVLTSACTPESREQNA